MLTMRGAPVLILSAACLGFAAVLYVTGWFSPVMYPDSYGYMRAAESSAPWGHERHPLYGWIILGLEGLGLQRSHLPALQFAGQCAAAFALMAAARTYGIDRPAALSLGLAAVLGQAVFLWGAALLPEIPSVSLLLIAIALVLLATRERQFWLMAIAMGFVGGAAYTLRPILAPAILLLPLLYLLLARMDNQGWRWLRAGALVALLAAPLILQSAYRYREVGDFSLVSFGGFGSLGVTAQMLTPELLPRLPEAQRPLAEEVLAAKQRAFDAQTAMPLFRNSRGERSFQTTAIDGFDMLARNFDEILWGQLVRLKGETESWVAFNRRMGGLSAAILRVTPERQLYWAAGATSRLVGRLFVYNAAFMLALAAFGAVAMANIARHGTALGGAMGASWTPLVLIVLTWIGSTSALTVVAAFPALRYTDTGGLLVTALPLYGLFLALAKTKSADPA